VIAKVVNLADISDFRPLLLIIPYAAVASLVSVVPPEDRAHPLSTEFIIADLPREVFDVIEF